MADLADVTITPSDSPDFPLQRVNVATDFPVLACMASQYAGWPLAEGDYFAMCSGPARSLRGREDVLKELDVIHQSDVAVGVLETSTVPTEEAIAKFASDCSVSESNVTLCVARTASLPGTIQVVARSVETAMHKLHELGFDLLSVKSGNGSAPLPPIAGDDLTALGWTNDAILYGGCVNLSVDTDDEAITSILDRVPSSSSSDFGTPFLDIFNSYDKDFYKIDKLLFSPAKVVINNLRSGNSKQCLSCNRQQLIDQSSSHGMHRTPTYRAWERIVRSENVCRRWAKFENFFADMGKRPSVNHHLVRTSTSKQWQPSNAEWMHKTKARRRPSNRGLKIKYKGRVQSLAAWAREIGISSTSLRARLNNPEWTRKETFEVGATR